MTTYAVRNETVKAALQAFEGGGRDAAKHVLKADLPEMNDCEIEDLVRMVLLSPQVLKETTKEPKSRKNTKC